uniref:Potassium channel subfamily K member 12-like n=1 Tax=Petromyzon marinus TaxID=7757 RepID=A0AAJ7TNV5_PETMA|nr:potassium channel subfamily K member 12-like [Petromyzon marinus]
MPAHGGGGGGGGGGGDCAGGGGGSPVCEDNARFALLALLIVCYMLFGAAVFSALERPAEEEARRRWCSRLSNFTRTHGVSTVAMEELLRDYEAASLQAAVGADELKPRWDFSGAFYFVSTVVSTIGFGMTTPATVPGKVFLIFYGMLGCSATILFFNLFLERLITLLACVMRSCRQRRFWRKGRQVAAAWVSEAGPSAPAAAAATAAAPCPGGTRHDGGAREAWKPSVYHVMLILGAAAIAIACSASALYSAVEDWSYVDSLYFCFVAFSTIGFGDLVSGQAAVAKDVDQSAYRFVNFAFILLGVCCIYSLFNVISIVIKQLLNWTLKKVEQARRYLWQRGFRPRGHNAVVPSNVHQHHEHNHHQQHQQQQHGRQQPRTQQQQQQQHSQQHQRHWQRRQQQQQQHQKMRTISIETDLGVDSETDGGRRMSGEMISMQDFLASNKVSLAIMQKQLSEAANGMTAASASSAPAAAVKVDNGFSYGVGSLAIMNNRLAETSVVN